MHELTKMIRDDMAVALGVTEPGAIAHTLFLIDIITCAGRSMNHSFNLGLYSARYAFWPMVLSIISIWVVQVSIGSLLTISAGLGVIGLWIAQALDEWTRGLAVSYLWLSKKWLPKTESH